MNFFQYWLTLVRTLVNLMLCCLHLYSTPNVCDLVETYQSRVLVADRVQITIVCCQRYNIV